MISTIPGIVAYLIVSRVRWPKRIPSVSPVTPDPEVMARIRAYTALSMVSAMARTDLHKALVTKKKHRQRRCRQCLYWRSLQNQYSTLNTPTASSGTRTE
jgi:hypothetical protein